MSPPLRAPPRPAPPVPPRAPPRVPASQPRSISGPGGPSAPRAGLGVMAAPGGGVQGSLLRLQESLSAADRCGAAMAGCQLLRALGQECVLSAGPAVLGA